jgi:hypothetical protein
VVSARMATLGPVDVTLGIWRFGMFGLALMLTLRFARNGIVAPVTASLDERRLRVAAARQTWQEGAGGSTIMQPPDSGETGQAFTR